VAVVNKFVYVRLTLKCFVIVLHLLLLSMELREREAGIGRYPGSIATDFDGVVMCYGRMSMSG